MHVESVRSYLLSPMQGRLEETVYSTKFQRMTSWWLLVLFALEGITGFGAGPTTASVISQFTLGILNRGNSLTWHFLLVIPLVFVFLLHAGSGVGIALYRRGYRQRVIYEVIIPSVLATVFGVSCYLTGLYIF